MKMKILSVMVKVALATASVSAMADQGPSTIYAPYLQSVAPGVSLTSILTAGEAIGDYRWVGIPDGLGAYKSGKDTITVLVNHEIGTPNGIVRAHGGYSAFVSELVINRKTLQVMSGADLIQTVYNWDAATQTPATTPSIINFSRFCAAELANESAFYNSKTKRGSKARLFLNGEEGGATGYAMAHVATGPGKGNSYVLGKFNPATDGTLGTAVGGWENLVANPKSGDKTVVVGLNDGGTQIMENSVAVYIGNKAKVGNEVEKAGLTNGVSKFIKVTGFADNLGTTIDELSDVNTRTTGITSGTPFTLSDVEVTTFSRPEDGAWSADGKSFFFVTTDRLDKTDLTGQTQLGGTRLWKLNFNSAFTGGTIDVLIDTATMPNGVGVTKPNMWDNISVNADGTITLLEDVGNADHNGKVWQFNPKTKSLKVLAKFDPALFGDIDPISGLFTAGTHTKDEESSGVIDVTELLDRHDGKQYSLLVSQDHASASSLQGIGAMDLSANPTEIYQGGQLLLLTRNKK
jgi:hypothetical protein